MSGIIFKQANAPAGGGGTITGAVNGLQVIGTDIGLGGVLTEAVTVISGNNNDLVVGDFGPGNSNITLQTGNPTGSVIIMTPNSLDISYSVDGVGEKDINLEAAGSNGITITDELDNTGMSWAADYSVNARSLALAIPSVGTVNGPNQIIDPTGTGIVVIGNNVPINGTCALEIISDVNGAGIGALFIGDKSTTDGITFFYDPDANQFEVDATNNEARLDLTSFGWGMVVPRVTNVQRLAIGNLNVGIWVYQIDTVGLSLEGLYVYKSTGWTFIG